MSFGIEGSYVDPGSGRMRQARVEWHERGRRLRGDEGVIVEASFLFDGGVEIPLTPTGPVLVADVDDPRAALATLGSLFEPGFRLDGDLPEIPEPPPEPRGVTIVY